MAEFFWYLIKSDLASLRYRTVKEAAIFFLMAVPLTRGGIKGRALRGKNFFYLCYSTAKVPTDIKLEGGLRP